MQPTQVLLCCAVMFSACESVTTGGHAVADFAPAVLKSPKDASTQLDAGSASSSPAMKEVVLDDGKILRILHDVNQGEIEMAQLALRRAVDMRIVSFAKTMISQHSDADRKATKLAADGKITLTDCAISARLETDGKQTMDKLTAVRDPDFDKAYIDANVKGHHDALVLLREQLRPKATTPPLQQFLDALIPTVQHHYDEAKKLSKSDTQLAVPN